MRNREGRCNFIGLVYLGFFCLSHMASLPPCVLLIIAFQNRCTRKKHRFFKKFSSLKFPHLIYLTFLAYLLPTPRKPRPNSQIPRATPPPPLCYFTICLPNGLFTTTPPPTPNASLFLFFSCTSLLKRDVLTKAAFRRLIYDLRRTIYDMYVSALAREKCESGIFETR